MPTTGEIEEIPMRNLSGTPSNVPSNAPSSAPSSAPSNAPSKAPSDAPSKAPSDAPSIPPSEAPSEAPNDAPNNEPRLGNERWYSIIERHPKTFGMIGFGLTIIIIVLIIIMFYEIIIRILYAPVETKICTSSACSNINKIVGNNVDMYRDACDNFFEYTCKNKYEDSQLVIAYSQILNELNQLITNVSDESPTYLLKLKSYYKSCMDDTSNIIHLQEKIDDLRGLNDTVVNITSMISNLYKTGVPANYFMKVSFETDFKNRSRNIIYLNQPVFSFQVNLEEEVEISKKVYQYIVKRIMIFLNEDEKTEKNILKAINLEEKLSRISNFSGEATFRPWETFTAFSIKDLQLKYPNIKWLEYLNGILSPYTKIDSSETVYVAMEYFEKLNKLLEIEKPSSDLIKRYSLFRTAEYFSRQLKVHRVEYASQQLGRRSTCTIAANTHMSLATSSLFVRNKKLDNAISIVRMMSENIRRAFIRNIQNVNWLNNEMKNKILNKITRMDILIGYPLELHNDTKLDEYYQDLDMPGGVYLLDLLKINRFKWKKSIENFRKPYKKTDWTQEYGATAYLDPFYTADNTVHIPTGLVNSLFFDESLPKYMNYAMIGETVGHEISHALDESSLHYDEFGNYKEDWWDPESKEAYFNKTKCIVQKYNKYGYKPDEVYVNGTLTLDENIADIHGSKAAYDAYIESIKNNPEEDKLLNFENFPNKQMFWIIYGSTWCPNRGLEETEVNIRETVATDNHAPVRFRIIGTTSSSTNFAKDFNCSQTDAMNPPEKCPLWF